MSGVEWLCLAQETIQYQAVTHHFVSSCFQSGILLHGACLCVNSMTNPLLVLHLPPEKSSVFKSGSYIIHINPAYHYGLNNFPHLSTSKCRTHKCSTF